MPPANISTVTRMGEDNSQFIHGDSDRARARERICNDRYAGVVWNIDSRQTQGHGTGRLQFTMLSIACCALRVTTHLVK